MDFLLRDAHDYNTLSIETLKELISVVPEFDFIVASNYCLMVCRMYTLHININTTLSRISEAKLLYGLYASAYTVTNGGKPHPNFLNMVQLFNDLENKSRFLIDTFMPFQGTVKEIMLQLTDSVSAGSDIMTIRKEGLLNPLRSEDKLDMPSRKTLNAVKTISLYAELISYPLYCEYILYGFVACPGLLFDVDTFDIFKTVGSQCLSIRLQHGICMNIHGELDAISQVFPSKAEKLVIPKGFVLRSALKEVAKDATKNCGLKFQVRRNVLKDELNTLNSLLLTAPHVVSPRLPQIMAAAAMAKADIMSYFRHLHMETRLECAKHLKPEHYKTPTTDMPMLLKELTNVAMKVAKKKDVIIKYYTDWLTRLDADALQKLSHRLEDTASDGLKDVLKSVIKDLRVLRPEDFLTATNKGSLSRMRFRCDQVQAYMMQRSSNERSRPIPTDIAIELCKRLRMITERTYILDSFETKIIRDRFEPLEMWYFQDFVLDSFIRATKDFSVESSSSLSILRTLSFAMDNCHPDCPEEALEVSVESISVCDQMCLELGNHITYVLQQLEEKLERLQAQMYPIEAAYRAERSKIAKLAGEEFYEPLPGVESKSWARKSILDLIYIKSIVVSFVQYSKDIGKFNVFNRQYSIQDLMRQQIESYLESRLSTLFGTESNFSLSTISTGVRTYGTICHTVQIAYSVLNLDFSNFFKNLLFNFFSPMSLPPAGSPVPFKVGIEDEDLPIWTLGRCVITLIEKMTKGSESEYIWHRPLRMLTLRHNHPCNKDDLMHVCSIIGPQGVRAIHYMIGNYILDHMDVIKEFLRVNRDTLLELRRDYCSTINAAFKLQNLTAFTKALIHIGSALAVRERFMLSLRDSNEIWIPGIITAIDAVLGSVDVWMHTSSDDGTHPAAPLFQIAADVGMKELSSIRDVSLQCLVQEGLISTVDKQEQEADIRSIELLPVAFASTFFASIWDTVHYDLQSEAFDGNEHTIGLAIPNLLMAALALEVNIGVNCDESLLSNVQECSKSYVEMASHFMTVMRVQEKEPQFKSKPLRAMSSVLEASVVEFPNSILSRSVLEMNYPYSMIHADNMDIALGKLRCSDRFDLALFDADATRT